MIRDRELGQPLTLEYIPAATVVPVYSINEHDPLERAWTLMELHNFSQLPVLRGGRVTGAVSWESIGRALTRDPAAKLSDCLVTPLPEAAITDDLLEVIFKVNEHGFVVVVREDRTPSGLVTGSDLGTAFAEIAGPYILLEQIEVCLRSIFSRLRKMGALSEEGILKALPKTEKSVDRAAEEFTLGELSTIVCNEQIWHHLNSHVDRATLAETLQASTRFRNRLAHFRALQEEDRHVSSGLRRLLGMVQRVDQDAARALQAES